MQCKSATEQCKEVLAPQVQGSHPKIDECSTTETRRQSDIMTAGSKRTLDVATSCDLVSPEVCENASIHPTKPTCKLRLICCGPIVGIFCLCLVLASIVAALAVLLGSHGTPVAEWTVGPSSYLAICTGIANQALRYAAIQGAITLWWSKAIHGTSIKQLHYDWWASTSLRGAFTLNRRSGLLGLVCISSTLVAIDGPLLQRATSIVSAPYIDKTTSINIVLAPELPTGFSGGYTNFTRNATFSPSFHSTIPTSNGSTISNHLIPMVNERLQSQYDNFLWNSPIIRGVAHGCPHQCRVKINAPALAQAQCDSKLLSVNYTADSLRSGQILPDGVHSDAFITDVSLMLGEKESLNLITGYSRTKDCVGSLNLTICTLQSAIGEYEVLVSGDAITLLPGEPRIVSLANNTAVIHDYDNELEYYPSTLGGIVSLVASIWDTVVQVVVEGKSISSLPLGPGHAAEYQDPSTQHATCPSYFDPRADILQSLNALMFYTGALAASKLSDSDLLARIDPGLAINNTAKHVEGIHNVYDTDLRWFAASTLVEIQCVLLILPTFMGWKRLGRSGSFSPLEIAKAFNAPLLADCRPDSSGREIANVVGNRKVQYGRKKSRLPQAEFKEVEVASTDYYSGEIGFYDINHEECRLGV